MSNIGNVLGLTALQDRSNNANVLGLTASQNGSNTNTVPRPTIFFGWCISNDNEWLDLANPKLSPFWTCLYMGTIIPAV